MYRYEKRSRDEREFYIEVLRIIAVIFVIFNHTDGYFLYYSNTENPLTWWFSFVGSALCRINVPLFIMITGALLLKKEESIGDLFRKRVSRISAVLIIFSLFYYTVNSIRNSDTDFSLGDFFKGLVNGSIQESFWYLYLYLGLLLLMPLLRKLALSCKNSELRYLLLLQTIMITGGGVFSWITDIGINSNLYILNEFVFYLLAGYYLGQRIDIKHISKQWIRGSLVINILCLLGTWMIVKAGYFRHGFYEQDLLRLFTPALAMGIFLDIRYLCQRYCFPKKFEIMLKEAGSCVFGIYLLEQFVRMQMLPLYLYLTQNTFGILACSGYVVCSFVLAWLYAELLKRIPVLNR